MKLLVISAIALVAVAGALARAQPPTATRPGDVQLSTIPPVFPQELAVVRRARSALNSPAQRNHRDTGVCADRSTVSIHCALERASRDERVSTAVLDAALQEARLVIWDVVVSREFEHPLMDYNNEASTTFADVQRLFRWLQSRVSKRLAQGNVSMSVRRDDSQANPPATRADLVIVREARALLQSERAWNSHDTRDCPAGATSFMHYDSG